jgi:hypothetical protein
MQGTRFSQRIPHKEFAATFKVTTISFLGAQGRHLIGTFAKLREVAWAGFKTRIA